MGKSSMCLTVIPSSSECSTFMLETPHSCCIVKHILLLHLLLLPVEILFEQFTFTRCIYIVFTNYRKYTQNATLLVVLRRLRRCRTLPMRAHSTCILWCIECAHIVSAHARACVHKLWRSLLNIYYIHTYTLTKIGELLFKVPVMFGPTRVSPTS